MSISSQPLDPIFDAKQGFWIWNITQIYTGQGTGRFVPNLDDGVWDWDQGLFRVVYVDRTTGLSQLTKWQPPKDPGVVTDEDVLLGAGPGTLSESYRLYLDTSTLPFTLATDARLHVYGTACTYMKIFLGTDIGDNGTVISAFYDQGGTLLGENIPLELVVMPDADNRAVKTPSVGYTTRELDDGEVCTAVFYNDAGHAVSIARLLIKNTAFIRSTDSSKKYITSIHLECPFLSGADSRMIEYPINVTLASLPMIGVVTYSDGSVRRIPVDGNKFNLYGRDNYVATILGQKIPLVLDYKLSSDEVNYIASSGHAHHVAVQYEATTIAAEGAYSVKLFCYPVWVDEVNGYRLDWFLYNLDRDAVYYATPYVELASNSAPFDPLLYGVTQRVTVGVNLQRVNGAYANYRHVQSLQIALLAPGTEYRDNWQITYTPGGDAYGPGLVAAATFVNVNYWKLDLTNDCASVEEWLRKVFYGSEPLFNPDLEVETPAPNFFRLVAGTYRVELNVSQWNQELVIPSGQVSEGQVVYLEFFKRMNSTDLELGVGGLVFHQNP